MWRIFANMYLYLPCIFSNGATRHVVEYDKFRIQLEFICNAVWTMFANIYLFLPLTLSNGVKRDVVEYDEFRFQLEITCNVVCEECLQISNYIYPLFYQMVSHDMLFCMINSDFSEKSFEMLYVKHICKYLFIFTLKSLKWCQTKCCWVRCVQISARNHL